MIEESKFWVAIGKEKDFYNAGTLSKESVILNRFKEESVS
jgi:hypothetical protein